jgi:hypothetical protein
MVKKKDACRSQSYCRHDSNYGYAWTITEKARLTANRKKIGKIEIWEYIPNFLIFPSDNHLKHFDVFSEPGDNGKALFKKTKILKKKLLEVLKIKN